MDDNILQEKLEEAEKAFNNREDEEAKGLYKEALETAEEANKDMEIEFIKGMFCLIKEKYEDAIDHLNIAIDIDQEFSKSYMYKGFALSKLNRPDEALECYDKALEYENEDGNLSNYKGDSLYSLERHEEALECYNEALKYESEDAVILMNKGDTLNKLGRRDESLEWYDKALNFESEKEDILNRKGNVFYSLGRPEEALDCYNEALKYDSEDGIILYNKGGTLYSLGRFEEALECYNEALKYESEDADIWNSKGDTLTKLGRSEEAKEFYDKAYEIENAKALEDEKRLEIEVQNEVRKELDKDRLDILAAKDKYEQELSSKLKPRESKFDYNFITVLRRWNSYTPTMITETEYNAGGGYYLYWEGKGIVIDPGFNFLDNFFKEDYIIFDIDAIIITHAHIDHLNDFESLLTLLFEYNEKNHDKKKIDVFLNLGAMKKLLSWIPIEDKCRDKSKDKCKDKSENDMIRRIYHLERDIPFHLPEYNLTLTATNAIHNEILTDTYSVGLILDLYDKHDNDQSEPFRIGYTSDTRHNEEIEEQYKDVDIIISHMGSIDKNDFKYKVKDSERNKNHLMLTGVSSTIYKSNATLAIVSEFGEELGEHRIKIVNALNNAFQRNKRARCLTGDIGLKVQIPDLNIKCHYCENFVDLDDTLEEIDPLNEYEKSIIYFCQDCKRTYDYIMRRKL